MAGKGHGKREEAPVGTIDLRTQIDIERPAAEVFTFVADQTNAPLWQQGLHEVRRLTPGPLGVGTEHTFSRQFAGKLVESRNRFIAFEAGRFVAFEITPAAGMSGSASYTVEPTGPTSARLVSEVHFKVTGPSSLATPLLRRVFQRDTKRDEATLKVLLEKGAG